MVISPLVCGENKKTGFPVFQKGHRNPVFVLKTSATRRSKFPFKVNGENPIYGFSLDPWLSAP